MTKKRQSKVSGRQYEFTIWDVYSKSLKVGTVLEVVRIRPVQNYKDGSIGPGRVVLKSVGYERLVQILKERT